MCAFAQRFSCSELMLLIVGVRDPMHTCSAALGARPSASEANVKAGRRYWAGPWSLECRSAELSAAREIWERSAPGRPHAEGATASALPSPRWRISSLCPTRLCQASARHEGPEPQTPPGCGSTSRLLGSLPTGTGTRNILGGEPVYRGAPGRHIGSFLGINTPAGSLLYQLTLSAFAIYRRFTCLSCVCVLLCRMARYAAM
jgi:hypothetical protein